MDYSSEEILGILFDILKVRYPFLVTNIAKRVGSDSSRWGETIKAQMPKQKVATEWVDATGFGTGVTNVEDEYITVPITINKFPVSATTISLKTAQGMSLNAEELIEERMTEAADAIGLKVLTDLLGGITPTSIPHEIVSAAANMDEDVLADITTLLNENGAAFGRFGIVNSKVMAALSTVPSIQSKEVHGQPGIAEFRNLKNIQGFKNIYEYPSVPAANNLLGIFAAPSALAYATTPPADIDLIREKLGITKATDMKWITDPESGMTLILAAYQQNNTGALTVSAGLMYGIAVGDQDGTTQYTGKHAVRLVSAATGGGE